MTPTRKRRMMMVGLILLGVSSAVALALTAFQENLLFFYSPSEIVDGKAPKDSLFRIGGMVEKGSFKRADDGLTVHFKVTDTAHATKVSYKGILPDLFREGQGIVAQGRLDPNGNFVATEVLAKHDENYMPPEAADAIKAAEARKATTKTIAQ